MADDRKYHFRQKIMLSTISDKVLREGFLGR